MLSVSHLFEIDDLVLYEDEYGFILEAEEGKTPTLNKPMASDRQAKKYMVYVKNDQGNIVKVHFGDPNLEIKRDNDERRKNFRARHKCDNPGPKWKPRYWACKTWEKNRTVGDVMAKGG
jgi:hypothetical protein